MASAPAQPVDFARLMAPVAQRLLGDPNKALSKGARLRFGNKGSMEVDTAEGWFDDHESNVRGGVLALIKHKLGCDDAGAFRWLEDERLKDVTPIIAVQPRRTFYDYRDEDGAILFRVERRGKHASPPFLQHGPDGRGGFHAARGCMQGVRRVPYRLPELLNSAPETIVYLCEGEKDADRLASHGLIATTNPGGAGKFTTDYAAKLRGRRVVLLEDNDDAGRNHVEIALEALNGIAARSAVLKLDDLPAKGDVSDWLDAGHTAAELHELAEQALNSGSISVEAFPLADLVIWGSTQAAPKTFIMPGLVPAGELTLCTGAGGANKSTFGQQLATCCAAGLPMLGVEVAQCSTLYLTCEDDEGRLHWVQEGICRATGARMADLAGRLHLGSLRGRLGNELATFDAEGRLRPSPSFHQLKATIALTKARLVVLDNSAHMFAGNENDRQQVTAFVNLLYSLCLDQGATIILVAHTNKQGDSWSGSTAWLNAVRSQIVITRPEDGMDPDERVLTIGKANYARQGEELRFRWHDFALVRDEDLPSDQRAELANAAQAGEENERFLKCLAKCTEDRRNVSHINGSNYAPKIFAGMPEAKGLNKAGFARAMERLLHLKAILLDQELWAGNDRHMRRGIKAAKGAGISAGTPAGTPCGDPRGPMSEIRRNPAGTHVAGTPPIYNIPGAAHGAAAPVAEQPEKTIRTVDFSRWENIND